MKITGKTLKSLGYRPGKWFKAALAYANEHQLEGEALTKYLTSIAPVIVDPRAESIPFHQNIRAETPKEHVNVESVLYGMSELMKTPTLVDGAVMPDACPTGPPGVIPVGGIAVAENAIHPAMHSADICCSVMMTSFKEVSPKEVLDAGHRATHFGGGGREWEQTFPLDDTLLRAIKDNPYFRSPKPEFLAKTHLGTQGDGNHFLFVGTSERTGETVMVTHHGSRGLGAFLYREGMKVAERFRKEISPKSYHKNAWIPFDTQEGADYWAALQLIRDWTKANHRVLHDDTLRRLKTDATNRFWNEHNFVFRDGNKFYHAKGATPLDDRFVPDSQDGLRLIPLNMREPVLIVRGATTATNLGFAPHGAGRNESRSAYLRSVAHKTTAEIFAEQTAGLDVRFYSGNVDASELPGAYKNAANVQQQMQEFGLGEVVDRILPYGCIMAGDWQRDAPWRKKRARKQARAKRR